MVNSVKSIVFTGAECTGKSTLSRVIAERLKEPRSSEFVRDYVEKLDRDLLESDLDPIAKGQFAYEDTAISEAKKYAILDTNILSSIVYADHYFNIELPWVNQAFQERKYHLYFLCEPDFPWVEDPGQRESDTTRSILQKKIINRLDSYAIPYVSLSGSLEERTHNVMKSIHSTFMRSIE